VSAFDEIVALSYELAIQGDVQQNLKYKTIPRQVFDVKTWPHKSITGGLSDKDRVILADHYRRANSVMEYGLGESTLIAYHVGVPYYVGIDSDLVWINMTRAKVDPRYRFYLADIGTTIGYGLPAENLTKAVLQYQLVPLIIEQRPFDVYFVDGRWRQACLVASFLHASSMAKNMKKSSSSTPIHRPTTVVLVHDCERHQYHRADHILSMKRVGDKLCVYQRLPRTTDQDLLQLWKLYHRDHD
jgi:hypothetical protein